MQPLFSPVTVESLWVSTLMVLGYLAALFIGALILPGLERRGYSLPNGDTKEYNSRG